MMPNTIKNFKTIEALYNATSEQFHFVQALKSTVLTEAGPILFIIPTSDITHDIFNHLLHDQCDQLLITKSINNPYYVQLYGKEFIFKGLPQIQHFDGHRFEKIYFIDSYDSLKRIMKHYQ